jgi:hypothetical protein
MDALIAAAASLPTSSRRSIFDPLPDALLDLGRADGAGSVCDGQTFGFLVRRVDRADGTILGVLRRLRVTDTAWRRFRAGRSAGELVQVDT